MRAVTAIAICPDLPWWPSLPPAIWARTFQGPTAVTLAEEHLIRLSVEVMLMQGELDSASIHVITHFDGLDDAFGAVHEVGGWARDCNILLHILRLLVMAAREATPWLPDLPQPRALTMLRQIAAMDVPVDLLPQPGETQVRDASRLAWQILLAIAPDPAKGAPPQANKMLREQADLAREMAGGVQAARLRERMGRHIPVVPSLPPNRSPTAHREKLLANLQQRFKEEQRREARLRAAASRLRRSVPWAMDLEFWTHIPPPGDQGGARFARAREQASQAVQQALQMEAEADELAVSARAVERAIVVLIQTLPA